MKQVAVLVETSLASGRDILGGVSRFLHEQNNWSVFHPTGPLGSMKPEALETWSGDGIIARINSAEMLKLVRSKGVPVVDVLGNMEGSGLPLVVPDDEAISRLVYVHFQERGYRHFAFFGLKCEPWSERRRVAFKACAQKNRGCTFASLEITHVEKDQAHWSSYMQRLSDFIERCPKPLALMVASDQLGPDIVESCRRLALSVPEQVAIVGVDDDTPFCEVCLPRLSSVRANHEQVGYQAACLLDALMNGKPASEQSLRIAPEKLHLRSSSDAIALEDPAVIKACQIIRSHACSGIKVDEIARATNLSRSVLQRRFLKLVGRTVFDAMLSVRLRRAQEMLSNTTLSFASVARSAGFKHQEYLGAVLKKHTGLTPAQYRKVHSPNPGLPTVADA